MIWCGFPFWKHSCSWDCAAIFFLYFFLFLFFWKSFSPRNTCRGSAGNEGMNAWIPFKETTRVGLQGSRQMQCRNLPSSLESNACAPTLSWKLTRRVASTFPSGKCLSSLTGQRVPKIGNVLSILDSQVGTRKGALGGGGDGAGRGVEERKFQQMESCETHYVKFFSQCVSLAQKHSPPTPGAYHVSVN